MQDSSAVRRGDHRAREHAASRGAAASVRSRVHGEQGAHETPDQERGAGHRRRTDRNPQERIYSQRCFSLQLFYGLLLFIIIFYQSFFLKIIYQCHFTVYIS